MFRLLFTLACGIYLLLFHILNLLDLVHTRLLILPLTTAPDCRTYFAGSRLWRLQTSGSVEIQVYTDHISHILIFS